MSHTSMSRLLLSTCILLYSLFLHLSLATTQVSAAGIIQPPLLSNTTALQNKVYLRAQLLALFAIDGVVQTYSMDFFTSSVWQAPLPAGSSFTCTDTSLTCTPVSTDDIKANFWTPQLEFINGRGDTTRMKDEPYKLVPDSSLPFDHEPLRDGWVWIQEDQRYQVVFATPMNMRAFPFDIQHLEMIIETTWKAAWVQLVYATPLKIDEITAEMTQTVGWTFLYHSLSTQENSYMYNGNTNSRFVYRSTWQRQPQYYLTKIVAGTMLLVWMCIWNFSLQVDESDRMMGTLQIFCGLIAFLFVASGDTPKLPYQTRLDVFMLFSFFIVSFIMLLHSILYYFREEGFEGKRAEKLEKLELQKRRAFLAKQGKLKTRAALHGSVNGNATPVTPATPVVQPGATSTSPASTTTTALTISTAESKQQAEANGKVHGEPDDLDEDEDDGGWELRLHDWKEFSVGAWFAALPCTRKWDGIIVPTLFCFYTIGCAVILGRKASDGVQ